MGILSGVKIIEMEGIGPGPFAAMHLADLGADVVRISRPNSPDPLSSLIMRGKKVITLNLKDEEDKAELMRLIAQADGLIEGMRPPSLIGDIAGGALYLTIGLLAAILNAQKTGKGDVIDAAMVDGSAHMMNLLLSLLPSGLLQMERGKSLLDGPHWYDSYACKDGEFITIGSLEPKFYTLLLENLSLTNDPDFSQQMNSKLWPTQKEKLVAIFETKTQKEWCEQMEGTDICFAPVLNPKDAAKHPHIQERLSSLRK